MPDFYSPLLSFYEASRFDRSRYTMDAPDRHNGHTECLFVRLTLRWSLTQCEVGNRFFVRLPEVQGNVVSSNSSAGVSVSERAAQTEIM